MRLKDHLYDACILCLLRLCTHMIQHAHAHAPIRHAHSRAFTRTPAHAPRIRHALTSDLLRHCSLSFFRAILRRRGMSHLDDDLEASITSEASGVGNASDDQQWE